MKDVQNTQDNRNVDIQKVGIKHVELPLIIQRKNASNKVVYAEARVCVSLPKDYKGTHMSRFVEVLNEWRTKDLLGVDIKGCLEKIIKNYMRKVENWSLILSILLIRNLRLQVYLHRCVMIVRLKELWMGMIISFIWV